MELSPDTDDFFDRHPLLSRAACATGAVLLVASLAACNSGETNTPGQNNTGPTATGSASTEAPQAKGEFAATPSWEQDFTQMPDGSIDTNVWLPNTNPEVPGWNNESQAYTNKPENVRIEGGQLVLEARKEAYEYSGDPEHRAFEYTSARVETFDSTNNEALPEGFTFEYGKITAVMKLPAETGTWPAFWLLSSNQPHTNKLIEQATHGMDSDEAEEKAESMWGKDEFYKHDGEIDILEHYGNNPGVAEGSVHTFNGPEGGFEGHGTSGDLTKGFHTYGVELTPDRIVWTLDDKPYFTYEKPSDNPDDWPFGNGNRLYVLLNLALGSDAGEIDPDMASSQLQVKKITFHEHQGDVSP